ncbi:MAG: hypothetical protein KC766_15370 [Myxococcales bacterium]|nr:hypothetical protein [Myxococcales bacterium]
MAYVIILFSIAAVAIGGYLFLVFREVPGAVEERLGEYEDLPQDIGEWVRDTQSDQARRAEAEGLFREVRVLLTQGGTFKGQRLVRQARYRDLETNKIARVEPDEELKRKRVKK